MASTIERMYVCTCTPNYIVTEEQYYSWIGSAMENASCPNDKYGWIVSIYIKEGLQLLAMPSHFSKFNNTLSFYLWWVVQYQSYKILQEYMASHKANCLGDINRTVFKDPSRHYIDTHYNIYGRLLLVYKHMCVLSDYLMK